MHPRTWQRATAILTGIYVSRMLGMFMLFPVFALYAHGLAGADEWLIGVALGAYGLSQGLLQIPCGYLSDRIGRKTVIAGGLLLFALGSLMAGMAEDITTMIVARIIQGMGAIAAVTMAYAVDISPPDKVGKVMAIIGASIGMSFVLSLIIGPLLSAWIGVDGIFFLIAALALAGMSASLFLPVVHTIAPPAPKGGYQRRGLWQASTAIFLLHGVFTAAFLVLPGLLLDEGLEKGQHWWLYLPANLLALALLRKRKAPHPLAFAIQFGYLAAALAILILPASIIQLAFAVSIFFIAFYRLETGLPQWVAQIADPQARGKAMGIYSSCQFLGSFFGAAAGGAVWRMSGQAWTVFALLTLIAACAALLLFYWGKAAPSSHEP